MCTHVFYLAMQKCSLQHQVVVILSMPCSWFSILSFQFSTCWDSISLGSPFARVLGSAHLLVEQITIPHSVNHTAQNIPQGWKRLDSFSASLRKWASGLGKLTLLWGGVLTWEQGSAPSNSPRPSWHGHRPPRLDLPGVHQQILPQRPICVTDNRWQQCRQQHHWYVKRLE